jgi:hypothetical protein
LITSTLLVVHVEPDVRRPDLHLFLLGAGFMLLETRSVTQMALLFGSTWIVNAVVFASILLTILVANYFVQTGAVAQPSITYVLLLVTHRPIGKVGENSPKCFLLGRDTALPPTL